MADMAGTGLRERNRRAAMAEVQKVAVRMMRQAGFANVTVEQIAESAGVSASTVYRYFGTKEALILWGDRPQQLVSIFAESGDTKGSTSTGAFIDAAIATYTDREPELLSQLRLVFANDDLAVAFEHELIGRRHDVAAIFAARRDANSAGVRDDAAAGAHLGLVVAMLDRWQSSDGAKSLAKMFAKAGDSLGG